MAGRVRGRGHVWRGCAWQGVVHGRVCVCGRGHAWWRGACHTCPLPPPQALRLRYTVNERAVRILLECILVNYDFLHCIVIDLDRPSDLY